MDILVQNTNIYILKIRTNYKRTTDAQVTGITEIRRGNNIHILRSLRQKI